MKRRPLPKPLASALVRRVFSIYLAFALALTALQIGIEYRNTYDAVLDELDTTAHAFEPGVYDALWNYQEPLLNSIARGMVNGGVITGVEIHDTSGRLHVAYARTGPHNEASGIAKQIVLYHAYGSTHEPIGLITVYSSHAVVLERVKLNVILIVLNAFLKTLGLGLIIMFIANRFLARPLRRFTAQIGTFDLATATRAPHIDIEPSASAELECLRDTFHQLTERAVLNKQLILQKEAAEEASIAKSRFLAAASHDLRQPMHAIMLYLGTLGGLELPAQARALLGKTRQCCHTMDEMFRALLDVSRLEARTTQPQLSVFAVAQVYERVRAQFEPQARAKGLTLKVARCNATAYSDPEMVERILRNFVSNAVRHTERGKILLGCRRRGDRLQLAVYDTGPGIPADKQRAVFEEFYKLDPPAPDRGRGLGLGLSIVERLAKLLGAPVTLVSTLGRGSMFAVDVPRARKK